MIHPKYRPDIDGLRAVAILSVVVFHAFPGLLPGGFVGVDIFFVISGFLISQIILGNLKQDNFSFIEFYARRIKRIFPALILVLFTCLIFGGFILLADEYQQLGRHIAGGAAFVSNFVLWNEVGYFDNSANTKPLLHLWSLGVEEQFYMIWPLLLLACWKNGIRLFWPIAVLATASFATNLSTVATSPEAAFYSPLSRFWELMAGSYLAYLKFQPPRGDHPDNRLSSAIARGIQAMDGPISANTRSLLGMGILVIAFATIDQSNHFPGWWALLPVLGAFLILAAGPDAWFNRHVLSRRGMILIGLISYPLYLWHWPILAFARIVEGESPAWPIRALSVAISVALAWGTYKILETPIRFHSRKKMVVVVLALCMMVLGVIGYKINASSGLKFRLNNLSQTEDPFMSPKTKLKRERDACRHNYPEMAGVCFSSLSKNPVPENPIFFIGDSHSEALSTGFINKFPDVQAHSFGAFGCLPFVGFERFTLGKSIGCAVTMENAYARIAQRPATVVLTGRYALYVSGHGYGKVEAEKPEESHIQRKGERFQQHADYAKTFTDTMRLTLKRLTEENQKVIFVHQVPELGFDPKACVSRPFRQHAQQSCRLEKHEVLKRQASYREAARTVLSEFPQVLVFDPLDYLCDEKYCDAQRGNTILYRDDDHLSLAGSGMLSTELLQLIRATPEASLKP